MSVGTVSNALNHPDRVSAPTLEKVGAAIDKLGFIRSGSARQLRAGRSSTIALVVQDLANPFYVEAAQAIEEALAERDQALMLCFTGGDPERQRRVVRVLLEHQVGGAIIASEGGAALHVAGELRSRGVRTVLMDSRMDGAEHSSVGVDDVAGGRLAVEHLLRSGHAQVAVITGPLEVPQGTDRWRGAREAVRAAGLHPSRALHLVEAASFTADGGAAAMTRVLEGWPDCGATFAANDVMAIGALRVLRASGRRVPAEMALVGYDDIPVAQELITPLTSVRQPVAELGRTAAELVLDDGAPARHVLFAPELVVRASAPA